jgi:hypothetical protein
MKRYQNISITQSIENPNRRYVTTKYPTISLDFTDIYVYTTIGDRYDLLAKAYYTDPSLWWIISSANYNLVQDSLIPPVGSQIRIPSPERIGFILSSFESLNI